MGINESLRRAVFLDRDGVLNKLVRNKTKSRPPTYIEEVLRDHYARELVSICKRYGFTPVIVTNQPDPGRGSVDLSSVQIVNSHIAKKVGVDEVYACFHPYDGMCECRKPGIGMFTLAANELRLDIERSVMIGDREKDIVAGKRAGCVTIGVGKEKLLDADIVVRNRAYLNQLLEGLISSNSKT